MSFTFFCCQGPFKVFLENYEFCQKSGSGIYSRGRGGGGGGGREGEQRYLFHYDGLHTKIDVRLNPYILTLL